MPENFSCVIETILAGSNHPAGLRSESVILCPPPRFTLIWKDEWSSENSHIAVHGTEEHTAEE